MSAEPPIDDIDANGELPEDVSPEAIAAARTPVAVEPAWRKYLRKFLEIQPWVALAVAVALAVWAWAVYPRQRAEPPPPPEKLYAEGLRALLSLLHPDLPLERDDAEATARAAARRFRELFIHYGGLLPERPGFVNPRLLLAESLRLRSRYENLNAEALREEALAAYTGALSWERRAWPEAYGLYYDFANHLRPGAESVPAGLSPALADLPENQRAGHWPRGLPERFEKLREEASLRAGELAERRRRRRGYIESRRAELLFALGRAASARDIWQSLADGDGDIDGDEAAAAVAGDAWPARPFEAGPEDRARRPGQIARALDALARYEEAEPYYRLALNHAAAGNARYDIQWRLGELAARRAARLRDGPGPLDPPEALPRALAETVYWYEAAAREPAGVEKRRLANFRAGRATLAYARLLPDAAPNTWERLERTIAAWEDAAGRFGGRPLTRRARRWPAARGSLAVEAGWRFPDPLASLTAWGLGRPLVRAGEHGRDEYDDDGHGDGDAAGSTDYGRRRAWLRRAAAHFGRTHAGRSDDLAFAARFGEGEAWLAAGMAGPARERFTALLLERVNDPPMALAARLALARVDLAEGRWEEAERRLLGGMERSATAALLATDRQDDATDWNLIAREVGTADPEKPSLARRIHDLLGVPGRDLARVAASGRRFGVDQRDEWVRELNRVLARRDFFDAGPDFAGLDVPAQFQWLLRRPAALLTDDEALWRNRLLFEANWPYDIAARGARDVVTSPPFPPAAKLPASDLLTPDGVREVLAELSAGLARRAARTASPAEKRRRWLRLEPVLRFALDDYAGEPTIFDHSLATMHAALARLAEDAGDRPAADDAWTAGGRALLRVFAADPLAERGPVLLEDAAAWFFRAGRLAWTATAAETYLGHFGRREDLAGGGPGLMRDLLARAYWLAGRREEALAAIRDNIRLRRTAEGLNALYYLGRLLGETAVDPGGGDRLGATAENPAPPADPRAGAGEADLTTALGAFSALRADSRLSPATQPWRWTTFALGPLWLDIARRERRAAESPPADVPAPTPAAPSAPDHSAERAALERARYHLREALDRYPLPDAPLSLPSPGADGVGAGDGADAGETVAEALCLRFETEFALAQTLERLADFPEEPDGDELRRTARRLWEELVDPLRYPSTMFDPAISSADLYPEMVRAMARAAGRTPPGADFHPALGRRIGPWFHPRLFARRLRYAYHALGMGYRDRAEESRAAGDAAAAAGYYDLALRTYDAAYDRLSTTEAPFLLYQKAEIQRRRGNRPEAEALYRQAITAARMQPADSPDGLLPQPVEDWSAISRGRLAELLAGMP